MDYATENSMTCSGVFTYGPPSDFGESMNRPQVHKVIMPAVNGISNAHSLARIYALLIGDVIENDTKASAILSKKTLNLAIGNVTPPNEYDQAFFGLPTIFSRGGFQLNGEFFHVLGQDGFGHKGNIVMILMSLCLKMFLFSFLGLGGSLAFASPSKQLTYAYISNQLDLTTLMTDPRHLEMLEIIDNILEQNSTS